MSSPDVPGKIPWEKMDNAIKDDSQGFPLRLPPSLHAEARKIAEQEGVSLNQLINLAVAEKISVLRTEEFFRVRAAGADVARARAILRRAGKESPCTGDELPVDRKKKRVGKKTR